MCPECTSVHHPAWLSHFPVESGAGNRSGSARSAARNQKSCEVKVSVLCWGHSQWGLASLPLPVVYIDYSLVICTDLQFVCCCICIAVLCWLLKFINTRNVYCLANTAMFTGFLHLIIYLSSCILLLISNCAYSNSKFSVLYLCTSNFQVAQFPPSPNRHLFRVFHELHLGDCYSRDLVIWNLRMIYTWLRKMKVYDAAAAAECCCCWWWWWQHKACRAHQSWLVVVQ